VLSLFNKHVKYKKYNLSYFDG